MNDTLYASEMYESRRLGYFNALLGMDTDSGLALTCAELVYRTPIRVNRYWEAEKFLERTRGESRDER